MAFKRRNTLRPDVWYANANAAAMQIAATAGSWIDPAVMVPTGKHDLETQRDQALQAAERSLNARTEQ